MAMLFVILEASAPEGAQAQTATAGTKPKPVATTSTKPALQTPTDAANATALGERQALQSDLAWVGRYNGTITGEVSERMIAAIKEFQKERGGKPTGVLNPQERSVLAETAKRRRDSVGWKILTDAGTGVQLGIPSKLVPQETSDAGGTRWSSPTGTIQVVLTRRKEAGPTTAKLAEQEKNAGRTIDYTVVKPDFFVLSGLQGQKKFYLRGTFRGDEVRILTILYDQATENMVGPAVIAMSSAFDPFPTGIQTARPPPRKTVEYGTGIVVGRDGMIVADRRATDGCLTIAIGGFGNADRLAEDKDHDLVLLRIYGARGLTPLSTATGTSKSAVELTGIADPQSQGGGSLASSMTATVTPVGNGGDLALSPAPGPGFSGAAARDIEGKFAGIALLRPLVVAGPPTAAPAAQAALIPADTVQEFLRANGVTATGGSMDATVEAKADAKNDAKASVVRVICVRK
jgi:hypothetical protein